MVGAMVGGEPLVHPMGEGRGGGILGIFDFSKFLDFFLEISEIQNNFKHFNKH